MTSTTVPTGTPPTAETSFTTAVPRLTGTRMRARARVTTVLSSGARGEPVSRLAVLRSEGALTLRPTIAQRSEPWVGGAAHAARVSVVAGAAGPVGGDHFELDLHVGPGTTLVLSEISHTLCLPGRDAAQSLTALRATVEDGATLIWLPEPLIAAHRCDHFTDVTIGLGHGSRLLVREELLLGRHAEESGRLRQRTRVNSGVRPIYHQDLRLGGDTSDGAAVVGQFRAVGSTLVVDPDWTDATTPPATGLGELAELMPLAGGAVLITAVAPDSLALRRVLQAGLGALGFPWNPTRAVQAANHHPARPAPSPADGIPGLDEGGSDER